LIILRGIEAAARLVASGYSAAALLLAWSTLEATVRLLSEEGSIVLDRLNPRHILKQAVIDVVIARDDHNFLANVMKYRNALIHGFKSIDFDLTLAKDLISTPKRLLQ
jgi:uncharacterized protein YutE (UPF0331/DUF86 family)